MKKGQISAEVMYSVGVMILIFLLILGMGFDLRADIRHLDDILQRKSECNRLATIISETPLSSYYTLTRTVLRNNAYIYRTGVIEIEGAVGRRISTATSCIFNAYIFSPSSECFKLKAYAATGGEQTIYISNYQGNVTILSLPEPVTSCS